MKHLAFILTIYHFISLLLLVYFKEWVFGFVDIDLWIFGEYPHTRRDNIFNFIDIHFYFVWFAIFVYGMMITNNKKYFTTFQLYCNWSVFTFLCFRYFNVLCECVHLSTVIFWGFFIVGFTFFAYLLHCLNWDKYKK